MDRRPSFPAARRHSPLMLVYILLGTVFEEFSSMLITLPLVLPIIVASLRSAVVGRSSVYPGRARADPSAVRHHRLPDPRHRAAYLNGTSTGASSVPDRRLRGADHLDLVSAVVSGCPAFSFVDKSLTERSIVGGQRRFAFLGAHVRLYLAAASRVLFKSRLF